jgi:hypothetical protein
MKVTLFDLWAVGHADNLPYQNGKSTKIGNTNGRRMPARKASSTASAASIWFGLNVIISGNRTNAS